MNRWVWICPVWPRRVSTGDSGSRRGPLAPPAGGCAAVPPAGRLRLPVCLFSSENSSALHFTRRGLDGVSTMKRACLWWVKGGPGKRGLIDPVPVYDDKERYGGTESTVLPPGWISPSLPGLWVHACPLDKVIFQLRLSCLVCLRQSPALFRAPLMRMSCSPHSARTGTFHLAKRLLAASPGLEEEPKHLLWLLQR